MNTINEQNWQMFWDVRRELGLDKPQPVELEEAIVRDRARPRGAGPRKIDTKQSSYVKRNLTADELPQPGEVTMKEFLMAEAKRCRISRNSVWYRLTEGRYGVSIRRVNPKLIYIKRIGPDPILDSQPLQGEIALKDWVARLAIKEGVSCNCIYNRLSRGLLIAPNKRVVNGRVVFVKP